MIRIHVQGFDCEIDRDLAIAIGVVAPLLLALMRWMLSGRRRK
jgi:hypothetical protein